MQTNSWRSLADRFWPKVCCGDDDACWPWIAQRNRGGYGSIRSGGRTGRYLRAHRVAYELAHGPIPNGFVVMHTCDNRACCNPAHLKLGTQQENIADMVAKGRSKWPRGPKLDAAAATAIKTLSEYRPLKQIAERFHVSVQTVAAIKNGRRRVQAVA